MVPCELLAFHLEGLHLCIPRIGSGSTVTLSKIKQLLKICNYAPFANHYSIFVVHSYRWGQKLQHISLYYGTQLLSKLNTLKYPIFTVTVYKYHLSPSSTSTTRCLVCTLMSCMYPAAVQRLQINFCPHS